MHACGRPWIGSAAGRSLRRGTSSTRQPPCWLPAAAIGHLLVPEEAHELLDQLERVAPKELPTAESASSIFVCNDVAEDWKRGLGAGFLLTLALIAAAILVILLTGTR